MWLHSFLDEEEETGHTWQIACTWIWALRWYVINFALSPKIILTHSFLVGEFIAAREFIGIYSGLLLYSHYSELLGFEFDANDHTFLFDTTRMHTIDATILGSTLKFINHQSAESPKMNCVSKKQFHRGHPSVAYFASRDIQPGEELFSTFVKFVSVSPF